MRLPSLLALLALTLSFSVSYVSVKLGPDVEKSKRVEHPSPGAGFSEIKVGPADRAWKSSKTGNVISYFSECAPNVVTLERMRDDVMSSLAEAKVVSSEVITFDEREALKSIIEGRLEGIPIRTSVLVYQKNGCRYSVNYSGRTTSFDREQDVYQQFERGFRAP